MELNLKQSKLNKLSLTFHIISVTAINMVNGLFSDDIGLWIGLNDQNQNRKYTWQDSSQLLMTNWAKGQPSYGVRIKG